MKMNKYISIILAFILTISTFIVSSPTDVIADTMRDPSEIVDPVIVVSLGDSYSAGEGIEPFYGQNKSLEKKVKDYDWLAHRSTKSWPSQLKAGGYTIGNYRAGFNDSEECKWYFAAASGAKTNHVKKDKQKKSYKKAISNGFLGIGKKYLEGSEKLPTQLSIFDDVEGTADYVTMTMGGNDVEFKTIIEKCAKGSTYLHTSELDNQISALWASFDETERNIKQAYKDTCDAAGSQAAVIVVGYPKLLEKTGKGALISEEEATTVNSNVSKFNKRLEQMVQDCRNSGMNIYFVDVETEFDKDGGHQAYSSDNWINPIFIFSKDEDIKDGDPSAYSIHPNEKGAKAYARCVNAKIAELEGSITSGTLSGRICQAANHNIPISEAEIKVYKDNEYYTKGVVDENGDYVITLPVGEYRIEIQAEGYIGFTSYATVVENENTYMETFLLVTGSQDDYSEVTGTITDSMTGMGVPDVKLSVREGWNNASKGSLISIIQTDSDGNYAATLPLGNYTLYAEKEGYISGTVNIYVQAENTPPQNGSIMPAIGGDGYQIVLTWGEDPRDMDSHIVGSLSNGTTFHVYYSNQNAYDNDQFICNLDVDNRYSYGPETITLNATSSRPYYYYVHRYAGVGTTASSGSKVKVYRSGTLIATYNVPSNQGDGDYWNVFKIVNGNIILTNTITSSPVVNDAYITDSIEDYDEDAYKKALETVPKLDDEDQDEDAAEQPVVDPIESEPASEPNTEPVESSEESDPQDLESIPEDEAQVSEGSDTDVVSENRSETPAVD